MEARQIRQTVNVYKLDSGSVFYSKMDQNLGVNLRTSQEVSIGSNFVERTNRCDPDAILDLATMYLSGCSVRQQSDEGALWALGAFLDPGCCSLP
ncbi:hypothetical protein C8Q72DRAFT_848718 [Fomitopsis betulina]|nr:hypothetical protein C8Q72DRAFT_848718 [Fomitopsis betulina]